MGADGIHVNIRLEEHKLCLLVMIGVRADSRKELIVLADGYRESAESWADLLRDRTDQGFTVKPQLSPAYRRPTADRVRPRVPRSAPRRVRQVCGDRRLPAPDQPQVGAASEHPDHDRDPAGQRDARGKHAAR